MSVSKEERQQARIDIRSWGADKKRDLVERLLNALDEADSEKAELQQESERKVRQLDEAVYKDPHGAATRGDPPDLVWGRLLDMVRKMRRS